MTEAGPKRRRRRRWRVWVAVLVVAPLALEGAARVTAWSVLQHEMPLLGPPHLMFWPELARLEQHPPQRGDGHRDVLLLGGSVVAPSWSLVGPLLQERLRAELSDPDLVVHDLARPAHTSLDSLCKYRHLDAARFDAVVDYDGINDVRCGACPAALYREDYGQLLWYRAIAGSEPAPWALEVGRRGWQPLLPVALRYAALTAAAGVGWIDAIAPEAEVPAAWYEQCRSLRTRDTLGSNLATLLAIAARRGEPVVLCTFALNLPPGEDGPQGGMAPPWGPRDIVRDVVGAQNAMVRELAAATPGAGFVDVAGALPAGPTLFKDACHLTTEGSKAWVAAVAPELVRVLRVSEPR